MHWDGGMGWGWAGALVGVTFMLLLIGGVVALIVVGLRASQPSQPRERGPEPSPTGAEQVLAERFARGEIDEEEYIQRRRALRGG